MTGNADPLDLRGLKCPLPVLRTRKALRGLTPGTRLTVLCTDPLAAIDIPHLVRSEGHVLIGQRLVDGIAIFEIVKGAAAMPQTTRGRMISLDRGREP